MSKKILLVEDSATELAILKDVLEGEGYEVISSGTGEDGVEKTRSEKPELVIIDTILPQLDGYGTCQRIREFSGGETPKIIMMTGSIDAIDAVTARRVGADDYCVKTSDFSPLIEAVRKLL